MPTAPQMVVTPNGTRNQYSLRFARLTIEWVFPKDLPPMPVALNWGKFGKERDLITLSDVTYNWGKKFSFTVPAGYEFDGASIPWFVRWAPGYERIGPHNWAALLHDWICDHPEDLPRVVGDGWFITILLDTGVRRWQSRVMHFAVRLWSVFRAWKLEPESAEQDLQVNPITFAVEASKLALPKDKAAAMTEAAQVAKDETTVPPSPLPE